MGVLLHNALTNGGRGLLADAQAGAVLIPTKIVIGSGYIPAGYTAETMTAVASKVVELTINKKERTPDGKCTFGGMYSNADVTADFYYRELALFMRAEYRDSSGNVTKSIAETLYSYGNFGDTADLMPAYSTGTAVEKQIDITTWVGNSAAVSLTVESGVQVTQEQKGQPGGIVGLDESGNINMAGSNINTEGGTVNVSGGTVDLGGGTINADGGTVDMGGGTVNMRGGTVSNLADPVKDGDAVTLGYLEKVAEQVAANAGSPFNYANNSDFTEPVNNQGLAYYAVAGETIDKWLAYEAGLTVTVADGYVMIQNTGTENSYFAQKDTARDLEYGNTYTCVAWFADGSKTVQQVKTQAGINFYSGITEKGIQFALADTDTLRIIMYVSGNTTVNIKHVAVYEGAYTADNLPKYQPKGYYVEAMNCQGSVASFDVLWENASPTSSFAAQDVACNLTNYDGLFVAFRSNYAMTQGDTGTKIVVGTIGIIPNIVDYCGMLKVSGYYIREINTNGIVDGYPLNDFRYFTIKADGLKFDGGYRQIGGQSAMTYGPNYCVPLVIYGVKIRGGD